MRARYFAFVVTALPSLAAAQSLCNPCVDPGIGSPRTPTLYQSDSATTTITVEDLQRLGLRSAADVLNQLPRSSFVPLVHETTVAAPLENVWRAWTTSAGLNSWLAPLAEIDLRIGGELRVAYDAAAGLDSGTAIVNEILAYDPPRVLAFRVVRTPSNFPFVEAVAAMWTMVYLDAVGAGATLVRVVVNGLADDDARAFFESGNAETLRRLEERFGTP